MTRDDLLREHHTVTSDLCDAQRKLGYLLGQERQIKVAAFSQSVGMSSDKQRENVGALNSLTVTVEVFKVRAEVDALTGVLEDIRLQLQYGGAEKE